VAAAVADPNPASAPEQGHDPPQELQVRKTVQRLLAAHLRRPDGTSGEAAQDIEPSPDETFWPGISLDLTGATLVGFDLREASVVQAAFDRAIFTGDAQFDGVTFTGPVEFVGATFTGENLFNGATFADGAWFATADFNGPVWFDGATFTGPASFFGAHFARHAWFGTATFAHDTQFHGATFADEAHFNGTTFDGSVSFDRATFTDDALFDGATFTGDAQFEGAHVLHLDDLDLNQRGDAARRVWPDGWTVCTDADDATHGTLIPAERTEPPGPADLPPAPTGQQPCLDHDAIDRAD
jgi:uncharacterized protein YjbI with pentapeptide repeats